MLLSLALTLAALPTPQSAIYVDGTATGANDGSSWVDAFADLQDAYAIAGSSDQVWVAEGVYRPTDDLDRSVSFEPTAPTYGGFVGHEASLAERAGLFDRTVLTGDLAGDDEPHFADYEENSYHVVNVTDNSMILLDGFTITGGSADGGGNDSLGGGVLAFARPVRLRRCRLTANRAAGQGGGLCAAFSIPGADLLEDCLLVGNEALADGGGASLIGSNAIVERCWFLGNRTVPGGFGGGGLYGGGMTVVDSVFAGNSANGCQNGGGAIKGSDLVVLRCTIYGNSAISLPGHLPTHGGGGIRASSTEFCHEVTILNSILWENVDDSGKSHRAQLQSWSPFIVSSQPAVFSSCVQNWAGLPCSGDVIDFDPLFVDPRGLDGVVGTLDDDLELSLESPCLDAGRARRNYPYLPPPESLLDAKGRRRHVDLLDPNDGLILDLGALERPAEE